ncbi:MAG: penicillin-binding protein 2, partial [Acidobacteria bacterium]
SEALAQNGWFVGFTPRRNPEIIVAVLFEGGEHGRLAARLATQVIKAYVDKQRRLPSKVAKQDHKVDVGAIWNEAGDEQFHGGRFLIDVAKPRLPLATAAPGLR